MMTTSQTQNYIAECKKYGIAPMPENYTVYKNSPPDENYLQDYPPPQPAIIDNNADLRTDILAGIIDLVVAPDTGRNSNNTHAVGLRILCLAWLIGKSEYSDLSMTDFARKINVSRAIISYHVDNLTKQTSIIHSRQKRNHRFKTGKSKVNEKIKC